MSSLNSLLSSYDYSLPPSLIAKEPARPRDTARLLVFNRSSSETSWDTFRNLPKYLPPHSLLIFNETKVIPARLHLKKSTGGIVETLCVALVGQQIVAMANKKLTLGDTLTLTKQYQFIVSARSDRQWLLRPLFPLKDLPTLLRRYGETPLPPYMKDSPLPERIRRTAYQAIFAKKEGAIAAPTASLHFTKRLLQSFKKHDIQTAFLTLHVGLGTFAPLTEEHIKSGTLHEELYEIPKNAAHLIAKAKKEGRHVIAIGTTSARALESAADTSGHLMKLSGKTDLFIREGYKWKVVDGLITNFHVPRSSLLMLVSSLIGHDRLLSLYEEAIKRKFRFFSFGDGMLIV